jgi:hypothetical protein
VFLQPSDGRFSNALQKPDQPRRPVAGAPSFARNGAQPSVETNQVGARFSDTAIDMAKSIHSDDDTEFWDQ